MIQLSLFGMDYKVVPFDDNYLDQLIKLIDEGFGSGYSSTKNITDHGYRVICTILGGKLIGAATLKVEGKIGILDFIVIATEYRGKGVAKALFKSRIEMAKGLKLDTLRINHWVRKGSSIPFCATDFGFKKTESAPNYWARESEIKGYVCAECKSIPCSCTRDLYELSLKA